MLNKDTFIFLHLSHLSVCTCAVCVLRLLKAAHMLLAPMCIMSANCYYMQHIVYHTSCLHTCIQLLVLLEHLHTAANTTQMLLAHLHTAANTTQMLLAHLHTAAKSTQVLLGCMLHKCMCSSIVILTITCKL